MAQQAEDVGKAGSMWCVKSLVSAGPRVLVLLWGLLSLWHPYMEKCQQGPSR